MQMSSFHDKNFKVHAKLFCVQYHLLESNNRIRELGCKHVEKTNCMLVGKMVDHTASNKFVVGIYQDWKERKVLYKPQQKLL